MQISDSAFPSGAFAHCYGLEQLVRERVVADAGRAGALRRVRACWQESLAHGDAPALRTSRRRRAHRRERRGDRPGPLAHEGGSRSCGRRALATGRRFLEEVSPYVDRRPDDRARISASGCRRTDARQHPVAFGVVVPRLGVAPRSVPGASCSGRDGDPAVGSASDAASRIATCRHACTALRPRNCGARRRCRPLIR